MQFILILLVMFGPAIAQGQAQTNPQANPASQGATMEAAAQAPAPSPPPMPEFAEQSALATATTDPDTTAADANLTPAPEYQLFDLLTSKDQLLEIQGQLVNTLVSANPALDGYQLVMRDWARKYLGREELREGMARVYRNNFSHQEIEDILEFYRSPTGRKSVLLLPILYLEGSQLGMELAQTHKTELIDMLRQAQERGQVPTPK